MCLAIPAKVLALPGDGTAQVESFGNRYEVEASLLDLKVGDYCLIHAGCAITKVSEEEALELVDLYDELEEIGC